MHGGSCGRSARGPFGRCAGRSPERSPALRRCIDYLLSGTCRTPAKSPSPEPGAGTHHARDERVTEKRQTGSGTMAGMADNSLLPTADALPQDAPDEQPGNVVHVAPAATHPRRGPPPSRLGLLSQCANDPVSVAGGAVHRDDDVKRRCFSKGHEVFHDLIASERCPIFVTAASALPSSSRPSSVQ